VKLGDQGKSWAPHKVCSVYVEELRQWSKGKKKSFPFGVPMIWREPRNHSDDCYFCPCNVKGYNSKNRKEMFYPNLPSAIRAVPHGPGKPMPVPPEVSEDTLLTQIKRTLTVIRTFSVIHVAQNPSFFLKVS
jgi:hypothetical protein